MKIFFFAKLNFKEGFFLQTRRIKMSKFSSLFTTILGVLGCSAAVALQPTVRAGSLSLNSAVKPTAGNVTSTVATQSTATPDASRGSALSKFSPAIVPVSRTNNNNNQNVNSAALDELRQEIARLTAAQNDLRDNQLSRSDVEDTVEDAVKELNLTTTNTDLKNTLSDLQSSNQSLQRSIDNLTNRTEDLEDTENGAVVNILKVRGLIDDKNTVPFALKTEIEPTALAQKIVTDSSATATLADKIQPKDTDIRDIITDELTEVGVLKNGALDVEKKGEVQVTEATVTNALRNSSNFKQMVSDEVATKGYVTTTALNERGFVTNDALNNKKFLSTDSVAFSKLATKDEIAPAAIAASIADSESAKQVLSGKIGPDESSVKGLITGELQRLQIVDGANTLKVATTAQIDPVSIATSIADNETAKAKLSGKIGPDESSVKGLIFDELKKRDIVDASDNLKLATASDVSVESLTDKLDNVFAGKNEIPTVDEKTVSAALANSTTLDDTIIRNLKTKRLLKDSGDLNVATNDSVSTLSSRVAVLDGGINDDGSLLNIIAKDETLKELLRGKDGKDGTSYKLKGSVETYENLVKNNVTQISDIVEGDGYFTQDTGKLYVYNCDSNGKNCRFPAEKDGIELKGEKGDKGDPGVSAETTWYSYCTTDNNLNNIIKPLYGTSKTCDNFTEEEYIALMDGSKAYCMLVAKNAKENSNYLVATKGIGKTLEDVFGSGTVSNLKNNGLSASVSINGQTEKFVFACAKKYDEIMNPKSAWYSYCSEGTNLTSIIQPLYGASTVKTCDDFTQEQYNAIMGGPKAYCLMVAKNVDSSTLNVKNNLKRLFGDTIVSTLSSQKVATKVTLNNKTISFVDACAQKYEEIMAGKSGDGYLYRGTIDNYSELSGKPCDAEHEADAYYNLEVSDALLYICACNDEKNSCSFPAKGKGVNFKGEPGENGKPASQIYCEAHAVNYPSDVTNLTLIQKLYPDRGISSCDPSVFTQDLYAAIIGGANAYCTSLNATFNTGVSLNEGVGLKLAKIYATKKSVSLSSAKDALRTLQAKDAKQRMNDSNFSILDECIANYNSIMSGDDAEKPEVTYCKAQAEHYKDGTLNRDLARKLFPNDTISDDCSNFTADMYAKMVGGADAFCANLTATFDKVSLDDGVGLKMAKLYMKSNTDVKDLASAKSAMRSALITNKTPAQRLDVKVFGGKSLLDACIANYNSIMSGDDAEKPEVTYCKAQAEHYKDGTLNRDLARKLFPNDTISDDCSNFTADMYAKMVGGADAFCANLTATFDKVSLDDGVGLKMAKLYMKSNTDVKDLAAAKSALTANLVTGKSAADRLNSSATKIFGGKSLLDACIANYNSIMSGDDGDTAWYAYCMEKDDKGVSNLTKIITPLYSNVTSCEQFTSDMYNAIMGGAKSYCLSLVQKVDTLDLNAGIGQKLVRTFGSEKMQNLKATSTVQGRLAMTGFKASSTKTDTTFMEACEARYNEIMSGTSTEQQYCEDNIEIVKKLYSKITSKEDCADKFTNADYTAIMGGSTAYCLSLVQNPTVLNLTEGIGKRMSAKLGSAKMAAFVDTKTYTTPQSRMAITGFTGKSSNNADFMTACKERYDEIMAGEDGEDGESAAYTWCKAHVVATGFRTVQNVKKMSAAKTINAFVARGNVATDLTKSGNEGYFTSMATCLAAVEADPSLMGGETAEESKFNADVAEGKKTFALNDAGKTALISTRTNFVNDIKGESFTPTFDSSTGMLSWTGSKGTNVSSMKVGQTANDIQNSVGTELIDLGLATRSTSGQLQRATSIVTTTDLGDENSAAGQALRNAETSRLANLGLVTVTGTGANQSVKSNVVTKNNLTTTMTNAGFAKASDVVSTADFAKQLQSSLNNTNVKNALTSAGFATKDDTSSQVVTMKDLSQLLSGGLVVDSAGNVKLDSSANNTNANAISSKLTAAKQKDSSIGTAKIRAESSIAASVANISVAAATANAAVSNDTGLDQEKCNQTDYMVWNEHAEEGKGMCEKCPDESVFYNPKGTTPSSRCKCDDPARKVAYNEDEQRYMCIDAGDENACLAEPDTYWNGTKCNKCPEGTYFNDESMDNSSLPRCVCEDKSATFNVSTGRCVAAGQSECASKNMVWSSKDQSCVECPPSAPFNESAQECVCEEPKLNFVIQDMACKLCEEGQVFSASTGECIDADRETCAINNHYFWNINDEKCYMCPEFAPYNATAGGCACQDEGLYFDTKSGECVDKCPDGAHYESSRHTCVCDDVNLSINPEEFKCM